MVTKDEARRRMRSARKAFVGRERQQAERQAGERLLAYLSETGTAWLFPFVSCRTEIDTLAVIGEVFTRLPSVSVAVPRVEGNAMHFYRIRSLGELALSAMGIPEPMGDSPVVPESGILLMPGLAFDRMGNRVGYGAGYYDRYLERHGLSAQNSRVLKMGYAFSFQMFDALECGEHDVPLDAVLTERELYWVKKS